MGLLSFRYLRGVVLGLMFFLAAMAFCSCDAYDPNPYDDIPPVVTVEFNYVVPSTVQVSHTAIRHDVKIISSAQHQPVQPADPVYIHDNQLIQAPFQGTSPTFLPLRR